MKRTMTTLLLAACTCAGVFQAAAFPAGSADAPGKDSLLVMFWNVENFFDYRSGSEYRPEYLTRRRFEAKCEAVCKTILAVSDRYGRYPDIVAFAEVESPSVTRALVGSTLLRKLGYDVVHYDSPDHRGIDCALIYRSAVLSLRSSSARHVLGGDGLPLATRDFLVARFDSLSVVVNHHPSKVGGGKAEMRGEVMSQMRCVADSLLALGAGRVLCVGDFNDTLWKSSGPETATLKYNGHWEKIDGYFAFGLPVEVEESVFADASLLEPDRNFGGMKPRRSFLGPRYLGGVSDHLPLVLLVKFD